jgi:hypothetical protein
LTLFLVLGLVFFGFPILAKLAVIFDNLRPSSSSNETQESLPPAPPILITPYEATNSAILNLSGFAQANGEIEVYLNHSSVGQISVNTDGSFNLGGLFLTEGQNELYAIVTDKATNKRAESEKTIILYDLTPPSLEIAQPKDKIVSEADVIEVAGKTDPDAKLLLNDHLVVIDQEGKFSYRLGLSIGENLVTVKAIDQAGNQAEQKLSINYSP